MKIPESLSLKKFYLVIKPKTLAVSVLLVFSAACGNQKKLSTQADVPRPTEPQFEHDLLVTTDDKPKEVKEPIASSSTQLNGFVNDWKGTPHVMGGTTKKGVDCSGFVIKAYADVYQINFRGRRAVDLFAETTKVKKAKLQEGDLVFFKVRGSRIDHVGIYLGDGNFAHTSSSRGVMVSNLSEAYWAKRFFMGGRKN